MRPASSLDVTEPHTDREDYDRDRGAVLSAHRLRVLRVTNDRIQAELPAVLAEILTYAPDLS